MAEIHNDKKSHTKLNTIAHVKGINNLKYVLKAKYK